MTRHETRRLRLARDQELSPADLEYRQEQQKYWNRYREKYGVDHVREVWRNNATKHREKRRKRAREAYAMRAAALELVREIQRKGIGALT